MCLSRYLDEMSSQLSAFVGYEAGSQWALDRIDGLEKGIRLFQKKLQRTRLTLQAFEQRIKEKRERIERLTNRIEVYLNLKDHANAWQYAMALDRLNKLLEEELAHFLQVGHAMQRLRAGKKQLQRKLANFLASFYPNNN